MVNKNSIQTTCIIGVMGVGRGVGTTHLTIMLGNYLANGLGKTVALLELNRNKAYSDMQHIKCSKISKFCFEEKNLKFYENVSYDSIPEIMANNYNYMILDISSNDLFGKNEFIRCHKKIVVGSLSRWKVHEYINFLENMQLLSEVAVCQFLSLSRDGKAAEFIEDNYKVKINQIPFELNPFYIESSHMEWIARILY
jgi:hypothetical protein